MKKIIICSSFLLLIFGTACKKEKQYPDTPPPVTDPIPRGGELMINQNFLIDHDTVQSMNDLQAIAHFTGPNVIDYLSVDAVTMNGTPLLMNAGGIAGYYGASIKSAIVWNWHVVGNSSVPNVDYIHSKPLPSFTAFASLPSTIDRKQNFMISLKGLTNTTSATIKINGGSNPVFKTFSVLPGTPNIQIPAAELAGLTQTDALVEIGFQNQDIVQISDRMFVFQNSILISKQMKVN
jgi:hypothetical protein